MRFNFGYFDPHIVREEMQEYNAVVAQAMSLLTSARSAYAQGDFPMAARRSRRVIEGAKMIATIDPETAENLIEVADKIAQKAEAAQTMVAGFADEEMVFPPGVDPLVWKEVRRGTRDFPRSWFFERPPEEPFQWKRETPVEDELAARALEKAAEAHIEAIRLIDRLQMKGAVDKLRDAFRASMIAATVAKDDTLRELARQSVRKIGQDFRTFKSVSLAGFSNTEMSGAHDEMILRVISLLTKARTAADEGEYSIAVGKGMTAALVAKDIAKVDPATGKMLAEEANKVVGEAKSAYVYHHDPHQWSEFHGKATPPGDALAWKRLDEAVESHADAIHLMDTNQPEKAAEKFRDAFGASLLAATVAEHDGLKAESRRVMDSIYKSFNTFKSMSLAGFGFDPELFKKMTPTTQARFKPSIEKMIKEEQRRIVGFRAPPSEKELWQRIVERTGQARF